MLITASWPDLLLRAANVTLPSTARSSSHRSTMTNADPCIAPPIPVVKKGAWLTSEERDALRKYVLWARGHDHSIRRIAKDTNRSYGKIQELLSGKDLLRPCRGLKGSRPTTPVHEAWGERKTLLEWSLDPRCAVHHITLRTRVLTMEWEVTKAIATPRSAQGRPASRSSARATPTDYGLGGEEVIRPEEACATPTHLDALIPPVSVPPPALRPRRRHGPTPSAAYPQSPAPVPGGGTNRVLPAGHTVNSTRARITETEQEPLFP
ncbi:helix-turn-helix domain-containing protein [Streptomyces sp. NPDC056987]|uniref:helix-turn-helix domain-containing protein n=1 Tax=Streptomyces sp. NPDC056987 TaxID=3345988 RepID=UPI0036392B5A